MKWFLAAVKQYATFSGRAQRSEYWFFFLFWWLIYIGLAIVDAFVFGTPGILAGLFAIGMFLPSIAVGVRRLHDTNRSGWWLLLNALPLFGWLVLFIFNVQDSQSGANSFGPNPKGIGDNQAAGENVPVRGSKALIIGIALVVAVPVLGILLAVALPAYQNYTERVKKAEASQASRSAAKRAPQESTGGQGQSPATPAIPAAPPPVGLEAAKPGIEVVKAPAVLPPVVNSLPAQPVDAASAPPKTSVPAVEAKPKQAAVRVVSQSAEPAKPKAKPKASECVYKPVMTDEDIAKCR